MSVPVMRMGLVGFADEKQLRNLLGTRNRNLHWERWPFIDADALWINGENATPLRGNMVRIPAAEPGKPATILNLKEIDRPTAFTLPIGNGYFTPPLAFDPHRVDQVADVLNQFEADLMDMAVELTLAAEISKRRHELASSSYHLTVHGRLIAMFSVSGDIGFAQQLSPYELAQADWAGRPAAGSDIPSHFRRTTMAQVMWNYVMRSVDDLLPSRYRQGLIYFRRMPLVPQKMIREEHMMLLSVLQTGPQSVQSLATSTGFSEVTVSQVLAALYFGGSLTSDPSKAAQTHAEPVLRSGSEEWPSSLPSSMPSGPTRPGKQLREDMHTVPAPLERPRKG